MLALQIKSPTHQTPTSLEIKNINLEINDDGVKIIYDVNKEIKSTTDEETNPKTGIENNYLILGISLILGIFMLAGISQKEVFRKI